MTSYTTRRAILDNVELTGIRQEVTQLLNLDKQLIKFHSLRRGDILIIETVEVSVKTKMEKEHRFGFDGQKIERQTDREEIVTSTETLKLWKTTKRGWYWK